MADQGSWLTKASVMVDVHSCIRHARIDDLVPLAQRVVSFSYAERALSVSNIVQPQLVGLVEQNFAL